MCIGACVFKCLYKRQRYCPCLVCHGMSGGEKEKDSVGAIMLLNICCNGNIMIIRRRMCTAFAQPKRRHEWGQVFFKGCDVLVIVSSVFSWICILKGGLSSG